MPYPRHWRVTFGGSLFTSEEWSCSLRIGDRSNGPGLSLYGHLNSPEALADVANDVRTFFTTSGIGLPGSARLGYVKLNEIGPDGRYASQTMSGTHFFPTPVPPATTTGVAAPQNALAVTLRSDRQRGPLTRGRFYLPTAYAPTSATDPLIPLAAAQSVANAVKTLVTNLNAWPGVDLNDAGVILVSNGGRGLPDGGRAAVTRIEVGRLVDTQRRRRAELLEAPVSVTV